MKFSPLLKVLVAFAASLSIAAPVHAIPMPDQREYILVVDETQVGQIQGAIEMTGGSVAEVYSGTGIMTATMPGTSVAVLKAMGVAVSERNTAGFKNAVVPEIDFLRGLDRIDEDALPLDKAFAPPSSENGAGVHIYVVDSGVVGTHEVFGGRVQTGIAFVNTPAQVGLSGTGPGNVDTCDGHGTHVAGIAAGAGIGVAPGATIIPVRVFGCDPSTNTKLTLTPQQQEADLLLAFQWINNHHQTGQPAVVNLSLGGNYEGTSAIDSLIAAGQAEGIAYVGAAGNDNKDACTKWPAAVPGVLGVGAFSMYQDVEERSYFSNWGSCVDISAPGGQASTAGGGALESIVSAWPFAQNGSASNTSYALSAGTSQASPFVAGAVARYLHANPGHTANQALTAVYNYGVMNKLATANLNGTPNRILYVPKTGFKVAAPTPTPTPTVTPTPTPTVTPTPTTPPVVTPTPTPTQPVTPAPARAAAPTGKSISTSVGKAVIRWTPPQGMASNSVVRYQIRWTTASGVAKWSSWKNVKSSSTMSYTITKLPRKTIRYAQIQAVTSNGAGHPLTISIRTK